MWDLIKCGMRCSPKQGVFLSVSWGRIRQIRICTELANRLYSSCSGDETANDDRTGCVKVQDYGGAKPWLMQNFSVVRVTADNGKCFNGAELLTVSAIVVLLGATLALVL
jgi:hypothetical protein